MGDFTSVGGVPRQQIFMLNVATSPATVTGWTSPEWDGSQGEATPSNPHNGYPYECATVEPYYIQAASWSPDDSTVYIATTGYHPNGWPTGHAAERPVRRGGGVPRHANPAAGYVLHNWVNYTGCDSLFATAAEPARGLHRRARAVVASNPTTCDALGTGGFNAPGMAGFVPGTGALMLNAAARLAVPAGSRAGRRRHAGQQRRPVDRQRQLRRTARCAAAPRGWPDSACCPTRRR